MSAARLAQLPEDDIAEVAFVGRSNSGKSSALNTICNIRQLARVSKTPGRTQLINLFQMRQPARLVDLPGYGYAAVPEAVKRQWRALVGGFLETRANLRGLIVLMDIRHPLTDIDRTMLSWSAAHQRPCHILLTKADKLSFGAARAVLLGTEKILKQEFPGVSVQLFSSPAATGIDAARTAVTEWLNGPPSTVMVAAAAVDSAARP